MAVQQNKKSRSARDMRRSHDALEASTLSVEKSTGEVHLRHQPTVGSRKIIAMQPNPVAAWELRLGDYRVLYDVDELQRAVTIQLIGEKRGNRLVVQGQEFTEHESR